MNKVSVGNGCYVHTYITKQLSSRGHSSPTLHSSLVIEWNFTFVMIRRIPYFVLFLFFVFFFLSFHFAINLASWARGRYSSLDNLT